MAPGMLANTFKKLWRYVLEIPFGIVNADVNEEREHPNLNFRNKLARQMNANEMNVDRFRRRGRTEFCAIFIDIIRITHSFCSIKD